MITGDLLTGLGGLADNEFDLPVRGTVLSASVPLRVIRGTSPAVTCTPRGCRCQPPRSRDFTARNLSLILATIVSVSCNDRGRFRSLLTSIAYALLQSYVSEILR